MALRCKVGDRRFIVGDAIRENLGRVVRVVAPSVGHSDVDWIVESEGSMLIGVIGPSFVAPVSTLRGLISDRNLRPLPGDLNEQPAPPVAVPETV